MPSLSQSLRPGTIVLLYACTAFVLILTMTGVVLAPAPPSGPPVQATSYGVITVYNSASFSGTITVRISTDSNGPFYVEKLLILLNAPVQADIVLSSISIDGAYVYTFNNYQQQPSRVLVVPSGSTIGDIITALPTYLSALLAKDPIGNIAMFASGATNGLAFGLTSPNGFVGTTYGALAIVVAPSSATVTLSLS